MRERSKADRFEGSDCYAPRSGSAGREFALCLPQAGSSFIGAPALNELRSHGTPGQARLVGTALRPRERMRSRLRFSHSGTNEALTLPALKRVIRVEALSRTAKALLPPHKCGGFHSILNRQRSCSRYLIWQTISFPRSALMASRGATFEPLLSIITFSGAPFRSIACSKSCAPRPCRDAPAAGSQWCRLPCRWPGTDSSSQRSN